MPDANDRPMTFLSYEREDNTYFKAELHSLAGEPRVHLTAWDKPDGTKSTIVLWPDECRFLIRALQAAVFEMDMAEGKVPGAKEPNA